MIFYDIHSERNGMVMDEMRNTNQIIGFPIISIMDGSKVGTAKGLIINAEQRSVDFLTIQHEDWQVSEKAVPFKKVIGIGDFAVTIDSANSIIDLTEIPIAHELVAKKLKIVGAKVITRKGELLGEVVEYYIDEENGRILSLSIKDGKSEAGEYGLSSEYIMTLGKDIIVVSEDALNSRFEAPKQEIGQEDLVQPQIYEKADEQEQHLEEDDEYVSLQKRQIEVLVGREVLKDIYDQAGSLIVAKGTILNKEKLVAISENKAVMVTLATNIR
jgi:uncharacterized protein YrrD